MTYREDEFWHSDEHRGGENFSLGLIDSRYRFLKQHPGK